MDGNEFDGKNLTAGVAARFRTPAGPRSLRKLSFSSLFYINTVALLIVTQGMTSRPGKYDRQDAKERNEARRAERGGRSAERGKR
jgi:hypothetical protein